MTDFKIEFAGICCHYRIHPSFIRVILVDASSHPRFPHIPHLEVQHDCVVGTPPLPRLKVNGKPSYSRDSVLYDAYLLNGVRMRMPSADQDPPDLQPEFTERVPQLTNVCPEFGSTNIANFANDQVPYNTPVAAQFDIRFGSLDVISISKACFFVPKRNDPPGEPGKARGLATVTQLTLKLISDPYLEIWKLDDVNAQPKRMQFVSGLERIRIGNMTKEGILDFDEKDDFEHFSIYYEMSDSNCTPLPSGKPAEPQEDPEGGLGGGCSNTQYP